MSVIDLDLIADSIVEGLNELFSIAKQLELKNNLPRPTDIISDPSPKPN